MASGADRAVAGAAVAAIMTGMTWLAEPAAADDAPFSWTGFHVGAHAGGGMNYNDFSNPYGPALFGDEVRSPGPFIGGQLGYSYQDGQVVYGLQADVTWANLQGTATCMQASHWVPGTTPTFRGGAFGATCQVEPDWFGTITARGGLALGPDGRVLVYGKGGLAWMHNNVEMAQNNSMAPDFGPDNALTKTRYTQWGWTLGAGLEYALSSRWSVGFAYDYLHFGERSVATPVGLPMGDPTLTGIAGAIAMDGRHASVRQDVHAAKLAINYALDERGGLSSEAVGSAGPVSVSAFASGLEAELGTRYVYAWTRFQKDLGNTGHPLPVNNSRLIWEDVGTNGVELFGRIDTPWNVMAKGFVGVGRGNQGGYIIDEDWGLEQGDPITSVQPYSNTKSDVSASLDYFTVDVGYDWLRNRTYRVASFVGYNYFRYKMNALGCTDMVFAPPQSCGVLPTMVFLQQTDKWRSWRLGTVAELMLTPQLKVTADAAYLPYVHYAGVDNHPLRAGDGPSTLSPGHGAGTGVQLEGIVSYDVTEQLSIGVGGRYWSMSVPRGLTNFFSTNQFVAQRFSTGQAALFAQGSYRFDAPD